MLTLMVIARALCSDDVIRVPRLCWRVTRCPWEKKEHLRICPVLTRIYWGLYPFARVGLGNDLVVKKSHSQAEMSLKTLWPNSAYNLLPHSYFWPCISSKGIRDQEKKRGRLCSCCWWECEWCNLNYTWCCLPDVWSSVSPFYYAK